MYRVIKYGAPWCHMCKQQDKEFENNPLNCQLSTVNVEDLSDEELTKLSIKSLPVTILWYEEEGAMQEVHRWIGFVKSDEINKQL